MSKLGLSITFFLDRKSRKKRLKQISGLIAEIYLYLIEAFYL